MLKDFVVFIISHGRHNNIKTLKTLNKCGYSGRTVFVLDNEDKTYDKYCENFGKDNIVVFDKKFYADQVDEGNNFDNRRTTTHARNACFDIAKELGYTYFLVLDDDYSDFHHRYIANNKLMSISVRNIDFVFFRYLEFYKSTKFLTITFAQGGDFIGGAGNPYAINMPLLRKAMNSFFCSTERPFKFIGQLNEDVNTYVVLGNRGELFGTLPIINLNQATTQKTKGGMTEAYLQYGTYIKSFTTVMMHPSGVKVSMMATANMRLHHLIDWGATKPMIISETNKKQ
jgi:hypothetical protein